MSAPRISLLYDGDCPICTRYRDYVVLRQTFGIELIDAREAPEMVTLLAAEGIDVDKGMVLSVDGVRFHGPDAVAMLDKLSRPATKRDKLVRRLIRIPGFLRIAYPIAKAIRIISLRLMGKETRIRRARSQEATHAHHSPDQVNR